MLTLNDQKYMGIIHTNTKGYSVYMLEAQDFGTLRQSFGFFIQSPQGKNSEIVYLKRSQIIKNKGAFDFLFDYDGGFFKSDIDTVKTEALQRMSRPERTEQIDFSSKYPIEQAYQELCRYVHDNDGDDGVCVSGGFCNVDTRNFDAIIKELDLGYSRLELLRWFKIIGLLRTNKNRPYDFMLTDENGQQYRVYRFQDGLQVGLADSDREAGSDLDHLKEAV